MKLRLGFVAALPILMFICSLHGQASDSVANLNTNNIFVIDPPPVLRLAGAQNLDVQIARQRLAKARANHESAVEQTFPWVSRGASVSASRSFRL